MKDEDREVESEPCQAGNVDTCCCCPISCPNGITNNDSGLTCD